MAPGRNDFLCSCVGQSRLNESVAEAALKLVQSSVEGLRDMAHDSQQFSQHPVLHHLLQGDKLRANNRPCLLYEFAQSVGILRFDASKYS